MSEITIRELSMDDFGAFAKLRALGLQTDPASFWNTVIEEEPVLRKKYEQRVVQTNNFTLGAFSENSLIGIMSFVRFELSKLQLKGEIHGVYVHVDHRGKGISSRLLERTLEIAFGQPGLEKVMLTVTEGNITAKSLYEKHGFREFGLEEKAMVVDGEVLGQHWMQITRKEWGN